MKPLGPSGFEESTKQYRAWLSSKVWISEQAWKHREEEVAKATPFAFLRATFYRWSQWWPEACEDLKDAPYVLGVGDLHIENFGTWRDAEGRLIWGVNDFDECCCLPYANDLVRLATSALFALVDKGAEKVMDKGKNDGASRQALQQEIKELIDKEGSRFEVICGKILDGYSKTINPDFKDLLRKPIVLAEKAVNAWLRKVALKKLAAEEGKDEFDKFRQDLTASLSGVQEHVPLLLWDAFNQSMPEKGLPFRIGTREAGLGSLGRQRFTAVVEDWRGGILAREAKALAPSAWMWWSEQRSSKTEVLCQALLDHAVRARDPWVRIEGQGTDCWIIRRLAPDAGKIRLKDLPSGDSRQDELMMAMGHETANVHVQLGPIWEDLMIRNGNADWLHKNALKMANVIMDDWASL